MSAAPGTAAPTCVVHLVWAPLGPEPLSRFLESYRRHETGLPHRLIVVFNGFEVRDDLEPWRRLLAGVEHDELHLVRPVLDLVAYREVTERVEAASYCFLNSYSVILSDGWLAALDAALRVPGVGLVGATGSWGSIRSYQRFMLGLGGPYASYFSDRRATNVALAVDPPPEPGERRRRQPVRFARALLAQSYGFATFPAPHIRTNAFMLARGVLDQLRVPVPRGKADAYRLESGRESITCRIEGLQLRSRVVGRDGHAYDQADWYASNTFWRRGQENLLIADNQTTRYTQADMFRREALSRYAWGPQADVGSDPGSLRTD